MSLPRPWCGPDSASCSEARPLSAGQPIWAEPEPPVIGSTAVPGLPAKPTIAIDLSVQDPADLHVFAPDCPELIRHQMFRDWLLAHVQDREQYAAAKRAAAAQLHATGDDQGALGFGMRYNAVKEPVAHEIYQRMFVEAGLASGPDGIG